MKLWMVRAERHGQQEQICLDNNLSAIGWSDLPDLTKFKTRQELTAEYQKVYSETSTSKVAANVGQVWRFANEIAD
jgi:restriction system protein